MKDNESELVTKLSEDILNSEWKNKEDERWNKII